MIAAILISAFTGTVIMTSYSLLMSKIRGQQFNEPQILANLLVKILPFQFFKTGNFLIGFIIHYAVGIVFMLCYWLLWNYTELSPTFLFGIIAGFVSGVVGVLIWEITFTAHPDPPEINKKRYYGQLIIAHVFFAVSATVFYIMFFFE